jgi:hypothetical protein
MKKRHPQERDDSGQGHDCRNQHAFGRHGFRPFSKWGCRGSVAGASG